VCVNDAFSKFAELIAIVDKHAETVAEALYSRRHYTPDVQAQPLEIVSV
jgi:hypothetical protein